MPALRRMSDSGNVSRQPFSERNQQAYTAGVAAFVSLAPRLAYLGMACMHLTDADAPALATCLRRLSHLRELDLHSNILAHVRGAAIGAALSYASALVHLQASGADLLPGVHLEDGRIVPTSERTCNSALLFQLRALAHLDIRHAVLTPDVLTELSQKTALEFSTLAACRMSRWQRCPALQTRSHCSSASPASESQDRVPQSRTAACKRRQGCLCVR